VLANVGHIQAGTARGLGFDIGIALGWLVLCYLVLSLGWTPTASRVVLALAVTLIFAILPCFMSPLAPGTNDAVYLALILWLAFAGPIAFVAFLLYMVVILGVKMIVLEMHRR
jgi:hypothetical protein